MANLSGSISATNLVDAMNETISIGTSMLVGQLETLHLLHKQLVVVIFYQY